MSATVRPWPLAGPKPRRARSRTYRLVERDAAGEASEVFQAPDDAAALARAREVAEGDTIELWRDAVLLDRWQGDAPRPPGWPQRDLRRRH